MKKGKIKRANCRFVSENRIKYMDCEWFFDIHMNVLIKHDLARDCYEAMVTLPSITERQDYGSIAICGNCIIIVPISTANVPIYNIDDSSLEYIQLHGKMLDGRVFLDAVVKSNNVYLIPCSFESMVRYDFRTKNVKYINIDENGYNAWGGICVDDEDIYFSRISDGELVRFNFKTESLSKVLIGEYKGGGVAFVSDMILYVPYKADCILLCTRDGKILKKIEDFPTDYFQGEYGSFCRIIDMESSIVLLPRAANMVLVIDKETLLIKSLAKIDNRENNGYYERYIPFITCYLDANDFALIKTQDGKIIKANGNEYETPQIMCDVSRVADDIYSRVMIEGRAWPNKLENFLEYIM